MKASISLLMSAVLALAGCHHRHDGRAVSATSSAISVSQARLVLPAVKGNPGAAYFRLSNGSAAPAMLVGVNIEGARKTEMHETSGDAMQPLTQLAIAPGQQVSFAPAGKHVMAFTLAPGLTPGSTSHVVLHFQGGKTIAAPLRIEAAGGGSDDMAGMNMPGMSMDAMSKDAKN